MQPNLGARVSGMGKQHCPCQCHWDLSWLHFGDTRIAPGDVDGLFVVERFGHFLYIETKRTSEPVPVGQRILLGALSCVPRFTVIVLRGDNNIPSSLVRVLNGKFCAEEPTTREHFQERVDRWFSLVDRKAS